jgi:putative PIN family toxin of toxin-antitoxin system
MTGVTNGGAPGAGELIVAVLDTNVLASGFVRAASVPGAILRGWRDGLFTLALSQPILAELEGVFRDPYFRRYLSDAHIEGAMRLVSTEAIVVAIPENLVSQVSGIATHPEDDLILATALACKASYLVTGDTKLQRLMAVAGTRNVSPRQFLDVIQG